MMTIFVLYSIFTTLFIIYIYWKPKFELKLIQDNIYNYYELYLYYTIKNDETEYKYGCVKLFSFKTKQKK